jgi:hypothetical protein
VICNIIDRRLRPYRWAKINAIVEATSYDNDCLDADISPPVSWENEVVFGKGPAANNRIKLFSAA